MALRLGTHLMSLHDRMLYEPVATPHPLLPRATCCVRHHRRRPGLGAATGGADVRRTGGGPGRRAGAHRRPFPSPTTCRRCSDRSTFALHLDPGTSLDVQVVGAVLPGAAFRPDDPDLAGLVVLDWQPFDWLEEDQPVTGHPHDAFKRIDVLPSSRHVVVSLDGVVLADTRDAFALHETHLPCAGTCLGGRDDGPPTSSRRPDHLRLQGPASYFSLADGSVDGRDIAWTYPDPLHDAPGCRTGSASTPSAPTSPSTGSPTTPVTPWSSPADQARF